MGVGGSIPTVGFSGKVEEMSNSRAKGRPLHQLISPSDIKNETDLLGRACIPINSVSE